MDDVTVNPAKGFPTLLVALEESGRDSSQHLNVKCTVPRIFEMLPRAMANLETDSKPVLAACGVIECCVRVHNEMGGIYGPPIDPKCLTQCQRHLVTLLKKAQEKGASSFSDDGIECPTSSQEVNAIALATIALFKLEDHTLECKAELKNAGGIAVALKAMGQGSGIKREAMQSLAWMLSSFLDNGPENVKSITANGGTYILLAYVKDPVKHDVPVDMQVHCRSVLESCVNFGKHVANRDELERALHTPIMRKTLSGSLASH